MNLPTARPVIGHDRAVQHLGQLKTLGYVTVAGNGSYFLTLQQLLKRKGCAKGKLLRLSNIYIFGNLRNSNQHSKGLSNIPFGGGIWISSRICAGINAFDGGKKPISTSSVRLWCFSALRSVRFRCGPPPQIDRKMRTDPEWCRQHCAAQDARGKGRGRMEFPFFFSFPLSFVYLVAYLYVHLNSPPPENAWAGLDDTPRLLKGRRHGGSVYVQQRVNIGA